MTCEAFVPKFRPLISSVPLTPGLAEVGFNELMVGAPEAVVKSKLNEVSVSDPIAMLTV